MTDLQADMMEKKDSSNQVFVILEGQLFKKNKQTGRDKIEKGKLKLRLVGKVRLRVWLSHI